MKTNPVKYIISEEISDKVFRFTSKKRALKKIARLKKTGKKGFLSFTENGACHGPFMFEPGVHGFN